MTDIPKWALEKALAAANDVHPHYPACPNWTAGEIMDDTGGVYRYQLIVRAFARYIAEHEEEPVDPDWEIAGDMCQALFRTGRKPWDQRRDAEDNLSSSQDWVYVAIKRGRTLERGE